MTKTSQSFSGKAIENVVQGKASKNALKRLRKKENKVKRGEKINRGSKRRKNEKKAEKLGFEYDNKKSKSKKYHFQSKIFADCIFCEFQRNKRSVKGHDVTECPKIRNVVWREVYVRTYFFTFQLTHIFSPIYNTNGII